MDKVKRSLDKKYREFISECWCLVCGAWGPNESHHVNERGNSGMGTKCSDHRCVPLCTYHHYIFHSQGRDTFMARFGLTDAHFEGAISTYNKEWEKRNAEP